MIEKAKIKRSEEYKEFIRSQVCIICWETNPDPHHETTQGGKGIALKCSDYSCIPLCRKHHEMREAIGKKTFWNKFGIDYKKEIEKLEEEYKELNLKKISKKE